MKYTWILVASPELEECSYCLQPQSPFTLLLQKVKDEDLIPKIKVFACEQCYDNNLEEFGDLENYREEENEN